MNVVNKGCGCVTIDGVYINRCGGHKPIKSENKSIKEKVMTELEQKRQAAKVALPEVEALIKKHGFEPINYIWQKVIAKERQVEKAREKARKAKKEVEKLERQLAEDL